MKFLLERLQDRVYLKNKNKCGPVHIVVGDGGNRDGLASS